MQSGSIILGLMVSGLLLAVSHADKGLFKINKLNLIWNKAQHSLGTSKLKDLHSDLKAQERDELNLKKMKAHNQDKDGLMEATVRKKLLTIMTKYSLDRYYDDIHAKEESKFNNKEAISKSKLVNVPTFRDSKLDKLWKKAEKAGFNQEQLMILHEEFQHQQDKLDEHYRTGNMIEENLEKNAEEFEKLKNAIERFDFDEKKRKLVSKHKEDPAVKKARLDENIQQTLKDKHSNLKKGYEDLHERIKSGVVDASKPFEEEPANDLWSMASQSNFTEEELRSLKEELEHYQTRIQKLKHFQNQLERQKIGSKDYSSNSDDDDESKHIRKRVTELSLKIQKAHQAIVGKIIKDEL